MLLHRCAKANCQNFAEFGQENNPDRLVVFVEGAFPDRELTLEFGKVDAYVWRR